MLSLWFLLVVCCALSTISLAGFQSLYDRWGKVCNVPGNNEVLSQFRYHVINDTSRTWSLNAAPVQLAFAPTSNLRYCENPRELADSIANPVSGHTCRMRWIGKEDLCPLMSKYSRFYVLGDSTTRHVLNSLHMVLSEDFQYGAFPNIGTARQPSPAPVCGCDGQFSETVWCRGFNRTFSFADIRDLGYCNETKFWRPFSMFATGDQYFVPATVIMPDLCTPHDPRPKLFYIQGGSHFDTSSYYYYSLYLTHQLAAIRKAQKTCLGHPYVVVYSGVPANSQAVADKYPDQTDSRTAGFNFEMADTLRREYPEVIFLNFWNLTKEAAAAGRTSDGMHSLSDTNLIKLMAILNVAELAVK